MAPLGLLTAVVSVIRVCGSASLRAFIGRAQESAGLAEIEILSCTSATTGELFNSQGGIARVFGSPQILEVVVTESVCSDKSKFEVKTLLEAGEEWKKRVKTELTKMNSKTQSPPEGTEKETANVLVSADPEARSDSQPIYRSPNLSLNLGIVKIDKRFTYLAAVFGIILQSGVLIFAILTVQPMYSHLFSDPEEAAPRPSYALPFTLTGTILVCTGMFFCAYIIEQCTKEIVYDRTERESKMYWVQPGNQKIGDQVFDSFIRESDKDNMRKYIISTRSQGKDNRPLLFTVALSSSLLGFVMQFVGLRALHASVTLAQIGSTLVMAIIRAMLRMKRSGDTSNMVFSKDSKGKTTSATSFEPENIEPWIEKPETLYGHELDLLAMKICNINMIFLGAAEDAKLEPDPSPTQASLDSEPLLDVRRQLAHLARWPDFEVRTVASSLKAVIEGTLEVLSPSLPKSFVGKSLCSWQISTRSVIAGVLGGGEIKNINIGLTKLEETIWQVEKEELEALVGLWALSIRRGNHHEMKKSSRPLDFHKKTVRLLSILKTSTGADQEPLSTAKRWCKIWITRRSKVLEILEGSMDNKDVFYGNNLSGIHLFGYSGCQKTLPRHSLAVHTGKGSIFDNSLELLCAQDIFCFFLEALVRTIDGNDIGGITETRPIVAQEDLFLLQNTVVEAIADQFQSNELGKREEAYMCIFPVLSRTGKLPRINSIIPTAIDRAEAYRHEKYWGKAFEVLEWLCYTDHTLSTLPNTAPDSYSNYRKLLSRAHIALGDLCHAAIREEEDDTIRLGFEGIRRMLQSQGVWERDPGQVDPVVGRQYGWIGLQVCKDRDLKKYKPLLDTGVDLNVIRDYDPSFPFVHWAEKNEIAAIKYLIGRGDSDINAQDASGAGETPIQWAVHNQNIEMVQLLLKAKARIDIRDKFGSSPASEASTGGSVEILDMLIQYDLKAVQAVSLNVGSDDRSLLVAAAKSGHLKCVEKILKILPLSVNLRDKHGDNALSTCMYSRRRADPTREMVNILLEHGASAQNQNVKGKNALHIAAEYGHDDAITAILSSDRVDINIRDSNGCTALHFAVQEISGRGIKALIIFGADPNVRNNQGQTALDIVIDRGKLEDVQLILGDATKEGFSTIPLSDENYALALERAGCSGYLEILEYLKSKIGSRIFGKALKNILEKCNDTTLNWLSETVTWVDLRYSKDTELSIRLEDASENPTRTLSVDRQGCIIYYMARDENGNTPLHLALIYDVIWVVEPLVKQGISLLQENNNKQIPLHMAVNRLNGWWVFHESRTLYPAIMGEIFESVLELLSGTESSTERTLILNWLASDNQTPLYLAAKMNNEAGVKKLLEMGADLNGPESGPSPLEGAVEGHAVQMVELLLEKGANVRRHSEKNPGLVYQAAEGSRPEILETLLKYLGADAVNTSWGDKVTPLSHALGGWYNNSDWWHIKTVYLLDCGARLTGIAYPYSDSSCIKYSSRILLGDVVDHCFQRRGYMVASLNPNSPVDSLWVWKRYKHIAKCLLATWKMENPTKGKEDAMKELGGKNVWSYGGAWDRYEDILPATKPLR